MPDKAIDLIDEAGSQLRMQIDSVPAEVDEVQRRVLQLEVEKQGLTRETDDASAARRDRIERELADLGERLNAMKGRWENEKAVIGRIGALNERIERARSEAERAEKDSNLQRAAELRYGEIPEAQQALEACKAELDELQRDGAMLNQEVGDEEIAAIVSKWSGVPVSRLMQGEADKLVHLEDRLHERVIGQHDAVQATARAVRRARAGLKDPDRPVGTFLFLGPTGVGKTELAKALAVSLFDDERAMVRLDMSEYSERHAVARMIGAPPGYVGHDEGGQLTEAVRRRPYSVVAAGRGGEGPPRRLQHPAPGAGRWTIDRRQGTDGRFPQHDLDPDVETSPRSTSWNMQAKSPRRFGTGSIANCARCSGPSSSTVWTRRSSSGPSSGTSCSRLSTCSWND